MLFVVTLDCAVLSAPIEGDWEAAMVFNKGGYDSGRSDNMRLGNDLLNTTRLTRSYNTPTTSELKMVGSSNGTPQGLTDGTEGLYGSVTASGLALIA